MTSRFKKGTIISHRDFPGTFEVLFVGEAFVELQDKYQHTLSVPHGKLIEWKFEGDATNETRRSPMDVNVDDFLEFPTGLQVRVKVVSPDGTVCIQYPNGDWKWLHKTELNSYKLHRVEPITFKSLNEKLDKLLTYFNLMEKE